MVNRFLVLALGAGVVTCAAQPPNRYIPVQAEANVRDLAAGKFLVAKRNLGDPNFNETVILLTRYDQKGAMGLVINRQTKFPLSRLFEEIKAARDRSDTAFTGGPVGRTGLLALIRSASKPEEAEHVLDDVYLVSSKELMEKTVAAKAPSSAFRAYLGYSGWAAGQLEFEVELGTWFIFPGDAAMVFDPEPASVWPRLIRRTELRIALARPPLVVRIKNTVSNQIE